MSDSQLTPRQPAHQNQQLFSEEDTSPNNPSLISAKDSSTPETGIPRSIGVPPMKEAYLPEIPIKEAEITYDRDSQTFEITDEENSDIIIKRYGANLPHWTRNGAIYAVTFRLNDSLPQSVIEKWAFECVDIINRAKQANRPLSKEEIKRLDKLFSDRVEKYLDAGHGACWLQRPEIATMVRNAIFFFAGKRYRLIAWCIMPNHVHVIFQPLPPFTLSQITHSWKSFTAHEAQRILQRYEEFWQSESYDHLIRDEADFYHQLNYLLSNPEKAGLKDWPWCGYIPDNPEDT